MINRLPTDVPVSGKRYDLTLTGAGLDSRKRELAMFVIDNGDHRGVRVSSYLTTPLIEALIESGAEAENFSTKALDAQKFDIRLSAQIVVERLMKNAGGIYSSVDDQYNDSNVYVVYHLSDYGDAENDTELAKAFERKSTKFQRKEKDEIITDVDAEATVDSTVVHVDADPSPGASAAKPKAKRTRKKASTKKSQ